MGWRRKGGKEGKEVERVTLGRISLIRTIFCVEFVLIIIIIIIIIISGSGMERGVREEKDVSREEGRTSRWEGRS